MSILYTITLARTHDLPLLPPIELAAAKLLAGHAAESVLRETTSHDDLERAQFQRLLWVALANDVPVGFAQVEVIEPSFAHLREIDVHPQHARRVLERDSSRPYAPGPRRPDTRQSRSPHFVTLHGTCLSMRDWDFTRFHSTISAMPCVRSSEMRPEGV